MININCKCYDQFSGKCLHEKMRFCLGCFRRSCMLVGNLSNHCEFQKQYPKPLTEGKIKGSMRNLLDKTDTSFKISPPKKIHRGPPNPRPIPLSRRKMVEKNIDNMQFKILSIIAQHSPFSLLEIKDCYLQVNSFDKTIKIIEFSLKYNINFNDARIKINETFNNL